MSWHHDPLIRFINHYRHFDPGLTGFPDEVTLGLVSTYHPQLLTAYWKRDRPTCEKDAGPMTELSLREELHRYLRSRERLLAVTLTPGDRACTDEEQKIVGYYTAEIAKVLGPQSTPQSGSDASSPC